MHFKPLVSQLSINPTIAMCGEKLDIVHKLAYLGHALVQTVAGRPGYILPQSQPVWYYS